ncbi:MAG: glucose 1-dehydrogenase [Rhodovibrionaceae bacterium]|nr:glucose 1-dehydrogenase [Rhodovibrionaceae bacterium]
MRLDGKVAVVTGGGSGFGEGIARRFAEEGARVVIGDLRRDAAEKVAADIAEAGGTAQAVAADVATREGNRALAAAARESFGRLDCFVANAGYTYSNKPLLEVSEEEFDRTYAVNVKGIYLAALEVVPAMREAGGGSILITGSTAGIRPRPGLTWYNGSQAAANLLAKSKAVELAPDGIRVNALAPVIGETGLLETFMGKPDTPENRAAFLAGIPLGRMSRPLDVANAALWLASDEAEFITGVVLEVDGGRCI